MTVKEAVIEKLEALPAHRQQELLEYANVLVQKEKPRGQRRSLQGIWADLNVNLTEEDLREARNEMWRGYTADTEDEK